jgi:hypothetical protein
MPGLAVWTVVISAISGRSAYLVPVPGVTTQILGSAVFALIVVFGVTCVRQWRAAQRWDKVLKEYADRDIAQRRVKAKHDRPAAHIRKTPPHRAGKSDGPGPR